MSKFQEYVTGQAFALTLSRRMCEALQFVATDREGHAALPNIPQLSTMHALEERGLVERNPWRLSEAGQLLYPLLAHAGLVDQRSDRLTFTNARAYASNS
jgi:hypothetical protein